METLKRGARGEEVITLQQKLKAQGCFTGVIGGNFLKLTEEAVKYFQSTHLGPEGEFLQVDGVVGPDTWWALDHPVGRPQKSFLPRRLPGGLTPLRQRQLELALAEHEAGVHEVPDGSNWGDGVVKYQGAKGAPWCCYFWSWCNRQAFGAYSLGAKFGHCLSAWNKAEELGMARPKESFDPVPGDAFVMLYRNSRGHLSGRGHIGFVLRVEMQNGRAVAINTVEGNSANRVKLGKRDLASPDIVGFINNYPDDEQPENWETGLVTAASSDGDTTR